MKRRNLLAGLLATLAAGCSKIGKTDAFAALADTAENLHRAAHRAIGGREALAREFDASKISPYFRGNGSTQIKDAAYRAHLANGFATFCSSRQPRADADRGRSSARGLRRR